MTREAQRGTLGPLAIFGLKSDVTLTGSLPPYDDIPAPMHGCGSTGPDFRRAKRQHSCLESPDFVQN